MRKLLKWSGIGCAVFIGLPMLLLTVIGMLTSRGMIDVDPDTNDIRLVPGGTVATWTPAEKTEVSVRNTERASRPTKTKVVVVITTTPLPPAVTLRNFNRLSEGMSYLDAVGILGSTGEIVSESNIAGIHTVMYSWTAPNGGNMNAMFQDGGLVSKAQFGLR